MRKVLALLMFAALLLAACVRGLATATPMGTPTPTEPEVIAKAVLQAISSQDVDAGLSLLADDVVFQQEPGGIKAEGKAQVEAIVRRSVMWKQQTSITVPPKVYGDTVTFSGRVTGDDLRIIGMESMNAEFEFRIRDSRISFWLTKPDPKDWKRATELMAGGVGIRVNVEAEGLRVTEFSKTSPAREAGMKVGDIIVAVDGVNYSQMRAGEWQLRIRGPIGSKIRLAVINKGTTAPADIEVIRADFESLWK